MELTDDEKKMAEEIRASKLLRWLIPFYLVFGFKDTINDFTVTIICFSNKDSVEYLIIVNVFFYHRTYGRASSAMSQPLRTPQTSSSPELPPWMWSGEGGR